MAQKTGTQHDFYYVHKREFVKKQRLLHPHKKHGEINWKILPHANVFRLQLDTDNFVVVLFKFTKQAKRREFGAVLPGVAFRTLEEAEKVLKQKITRFNSWQPWKADKNVLIFVDTFYRRSKALSWKRGFYKASMAVINHARQHDIFTWLCLQSYMTTPLINSILFAANGDWTSFDQKFGNVIKTHKRVSKYADPKDPYNIFNTFFKAMLVESAEVGKFLYDRSGKHKISNEKTLRQYYPEMVPFLDMKDKADFTLAYISAIQEVILSVPRLINSVETFRGYTPLGIPDTLTLDIDDLTNGQKITTWGFMSVSLSSEIAADFLDDSAQCCMLKVIIPSHMVAFLIQSHSRDKKFPKNLSPFYGEEEILLPAGTVVQVTKKKGLRAYKNAKGNIITTKTAQVTVVDLKAPKLPKTTLGVENVTKHPLEKMRSLMTLVFGK